MSKAKQATLDGLDEPWKDEETLRNLYDGRTQGEVADYLKENGHDVTGSTISYWMKKLGVNTSHTKHDENEEQETRKCKYHEVCGNDTPGIGNAMCITCLDFARRRSTESGSPEEFHENVLGGEFTTMLDHFEKLHERYDE